MSPDPFRGIGDGRHPDPNGAMVRVQEASAMIFEKIYKKEAKMKKELIVIGLLLSINYLYGDTTLFRAEFHKGTSFFEFFKQFSQCSLCISDVA